MLKVLRCEVDSIPHSTSPYFDAMAQEVLARGLNLRFKVSGESMYPFIHAGDILLVEPNSTADFRIGDILFCRLPSGNYVVHRLVRKNGSEMLITKGDNLSYYDAPFPSEQAIGRVIQIEGYKKQLKLYGWLGRTFSWLIARLALGRYSNQTRLRRNIGRIWWLIGGRRVA